jgi:two-component system, response regulator YesN
MKKILIVDDEKFIRNGISAIISNNFPELFQIELAKNGQEALEIMKKIEFDLVITDINMPFMNGIDFIKEISQIFGELNVIVISGYDEFEYARKCMKYGVKNYLLKPINDKELVEIVKETMTSDNEVISEINEDEKKLEYVYIEKAKDYIEKNYYKDINMAVVSNYVSLNYSYFSSIFNRDTGMNFSDYLNFVRVEKAKVLLKNIDYKIHEVSEIVGYKNPKHFTKNFKKFTKLTPVEYRISK